MILQSDLKNEKEKMFAISADMTNQYKQMQQQFLKEIDALKVTIDNQAQELQTKDDAIKDLQKQHESLVFKKDEEIKELKKKADEMSIEFARMLKNLLGKMNEKIEISQWQNTEFKHVNAALNNN